MKNINTRNLVTVALLVALNIILSRFIQIPLPPFNRITFGFIAIVLMGYLLGSVYAVIGAATADFLGAILFPVGGAYFPGFTLTAMITGFIYGKMFYGHTASLKRIIIANLLVIVLSHLLLNSIWLSMLTGKAFLVILIPKIVKNFLMLPIESAMIFVILKYVCGYIKPFSPKTM